MILLILNEIDRLIKFYLTILFYSRRFFYRDAVFVILPHCAHFSKLRIDPHVNSIFYIPHF